MSGLGGKNEICAAVDDEFRDGVFLGVNPHRFRDFVVFDKRQEELEAKREFHMTWLSYLECEST